MQKYEPSVILYQSNVADIQKAIKSIEKTSFDRVVVQISNSEFVHREFGNPTQSQHNFFTRSDLLLSGNDYRFKVILKLSDTTDCNSPDTQVQWHSKKIIRQGKTRYFFFTMNTKYSFVFPHFTDTRRDRMGEVFEWRRSIVVSIAKNWFVEFGEGITRSVWWEGLGHCRDIVHRPI